MSPEQAELTNDDIDTRSDVYSLGVLLYELLTGSTPLTRHSINTLALDQVLKSIRTDPVDSPRDRVSHLPAAHQELIAKNRKLDIGQLHEVLSEDLEWMTGKSLKKNREDRYETAGAFANDINNYLKNRDIDARPTGDWLRASITKEKTLASKRKSLALFFCLAVVCGVLRWFFVDVLDLLAPLTSLVLLFAWVSRLPMEFSRGDPPVVGWYFLLTLGILGLFAAETSGFMFWMSVPVSMISTGQLIVFGVKHVLIDLMANRSSNLEFDEI